MAPFGISITKLSIIKLSITKLSITKLSVTKFVSSVGPEKLDYGSHFSILLFL